MSEACWRIAIRNLEDTDLLGAMLAKHLPDGAVVVLSGTLGAGKTRLVQGLAAACGVDRQGVVSPTFVLCQHYHGQRLLHHLDAYRIADDDEFLNLGVEELFESTGITLIEWGERVRRCLPDEYLEITLEVTGESSRQARLTPRGAQLTDAIRNLMAELGESN